MDTVSPSLPDNADKWMICRVGDSVRFYGGNKVIIYRGEYCIAIFRTPEKRRCAMPGGHVFLSAIPRSEIN